MDVNRLSCALESRELLALCLKKIKGLHKDVKVDQRGTLSSHTLYSLDPIN
jgi:hypothetical protein